MSIWRFADNFDAVGHRSRVTLGEGATPLVRSKHLGECFGLKNLFFKMESSNPTGSYKDRFAACAISHMVEADQKRCVATSSGNTGAALAAYCAAAGVSCRIAVLETTPTGKLQQMMAYGTKIWVHPGFLWVSGCRRATGVFFKHAFGFKRCRSLPQRIAPGLSPSPGHTPAEFWWHR